MHVVQSATNRLGCNPETKWRALHLRASSPAGEGENWLRTVNYSHNLDHRLKLPVSLLPPVHERKPGWLGEGGYDACSMSVCVYAEGLIRSGEIAAEIHKEAKQQVLLVKCIYKFGSRGRCVCTGINAVHGENLLVILESIQVQPGSYSEIY